MFSQFSSRTGVPMVDFFFNGFATMLEMQRAFASGGTLTAPMTQNFGHPQQSRHVEIGATEQQVIPIPKEELRVGKRQIQSAKAYRVSTTVIEVPVEEQVNLRAETVVIERRPTTGTTVRGGESFQNHTIEVHEMYEEPVIGKVITQTEEMVIYKTLSERTATIRETVRQTRVNVDEQADVRGQPQVEHSREIRLKLDEQSQAPVLPQVETGRELDLKVEEQPKAPVLPKVETARETGFMTEEQNKILVHSQTDAEGAAGFRVAEGEKSRERAVVQAHDERKDHTKPGSGTKHPGSPKK